MTRIRSNQENENSGILAAKSAFKRPLHHFRMPREHEEQNENKKAGADEDLDEGQNGHEPVEKRFSPNPVRDHADDCDRFEDGQSEINDVGIVELVMICQPATGQKISIDGDGGD